MKAVRCLLVIAGSLLPLIGLAAERAVPRVADALAPLPPGAVKLRGQLGATIDIGLQHRVAAQNVDDLIAPFRVRADKNEWRSEFWGKWITSAIPAWRYSGNEAFHDLDGRAVTGLISTQTPDGYIGAYPDGGHLQHWDVWGRKYTLLGLIAWYDATGDEAALKAACREADFTLGEVGPAGHASPFTNDMWSGLASSSILEPMVLLYRRTGDARYLQFAQYIVEKWPAADGPDLLRKTLAGTAVYDMFPKPNPKIKGYGGGGKSKAYEMMSCFEGLAELYRTTGNPEYRDAVVKAFANIRDTEITVIGSGSDWERWNGGRTRQTETWSKGMETCVTVTWMKYAAQVLRLTGESTYADEIERTTFNALLGAQATDGSWWCHHSPLAGIKERAPEQCQMHQNCCVANGPRGLMLIPQIAVMTSALGPVINLYNAMEARLTTPAGEDLSLKQETDFPAGNTVRVLVSPAQSSEFTLRLRIPAWSETTSLTVNGKAEPAPRAGTYAAIRRTWRKGDTVTLKLDFRTRVVPAPGHPDYVAFLRGPLVFARDARLEKGANVDAPIAYVPSASGVVSGARVGPSTIPHVWQMLTVVANDPAKSELHLCDFASAGNTWDEASHFRVWLPVGSATTRVAQ